MMEGVGPGVKMEEMRSVKKAAMVDAEDAVRMLSKSLRYSGQASRRISTRLFSVGIQVLAGVLCDLFWVVVKECVSISNL